MNPLFRIDFSISDSLKIVRKSVLIYETIIQTVLQNIWIMLNLLLKTENIVHLQDIIKG